MTENPRREMYPLMVVIRAAGAMTSMVVILLCLAMRPALLAGWPVATVEVAAPLLEVETDEIATEAMSPAASVSAAPHRTGCRGAGREPIAVIGEPGEDVSAIPLFAPEAGS